MSLNITFDRTDLNRLRDMVRKVPYLTEDYKLKSNIGQLLAAQAKKNINEQSPDGTSKYEALHEKTEQYKGFDLILIGRKKNTTTKKGTTNNKGVQSGVLRKSIDFEVGHGKAIYLTAINYAKYHQFGTKDLPKREIFTIRKSNLKTIMSFITAAFKKAINK